MVHRLPHSEQRLHTPQSEQREFVPPIVAYSNLFERKNMNPNLTPDIAQAEQFLHLLDPRGIFTFQTFDDDKVRKNMRLACVYHGTMDEHLAKLAALQQCGAGIFFMVNQGDGIVHPGSKTCRTRRNVTGVRALFADLDGSPLEPILGDIHPDIIVESSPRRWHAYWLTSDCPLDEFGLRQKQIAMKYNADGAVSDLPRVMRLPGFWHQKDEPFLTRIVFPE